MSKKYNKVVFDLSGTVFTCTPSIGMVIEDVKKHIFLMQVPERRGKFLRRLPALNVEINVCPQIRDNE